MKDELNRAEGFYELGMFEDAWEAIEDLPFDDFRLSAGVLDLRLRILTGLESWPLGGEIASLLVKAPEEAHKETVARFHHAHARALSKAGEIARSKKAIAKAVRAWKPIRKELVEDQELDALWEPLP